MEFQTSVNLWKRHFVFNCRRVIWSSFLVSKNTDGGAWVPEDQLKNQALKSGETKTSSSPSESPHSTQISSQFPVQMLLLAARSNQCPQTSSFSPSLSVNCKTVPVLSFGYGSGSSASSRALCFPISRWPTVSCWSWELSKSKTFPAQYVRICAVVVMYWVWGQNILHADRRTSCDRPSRHMHPWVSSVFKQLLVGSQNSNLLNGCFLRSPPRLNLSKSTPLL